MRTVGYRHSRCGEASREGQLTGVINDVDEASGHDPGRALTFWSAPTSLDVWHGCRARAKHKAFPELRNARSGHRAHVSDKFRRDRFEASKDPHAPPRLAQRGPEEDGDRVRGEASYWRVSVRKRGSEEVPQCGLGRRRGAPPDILIIIVEDSDKVRYRPVGYRQSYAPWRWQRGAGPGTDSQGRSFAVSTWSTSSSSHWGPGTVGTRASE